MLVAGVRILDSLRIFSIDSRVGANRIFRVSQNWGMINITLIKFFSCWSSMRVLVSLYFRTSLLNLAMLNLICLPPLIVFYDDVYFLVVGFLFHYHTGFPLSASPVSFFRCVDCVENIFGNFLDGLLLDDWTALNKGVTHILQSDNWITPSSVLSNYPATTRQENSLKYFPVKTRNWSLRNCVVKLTKRTVHRGDNETK